MKRDITRTLFFPETHGRSSFRHGPPRVWIDCPTNAFRNSPLKNLNKQRLAWLFAAALIVVALTPVARGVWDARQSRVRFIAVSNARSMLEGAAPSLAPHIRNAKNALEAHEAITAAIRQQGWLNDVLESGSELIMHDLGAEPLAESARLVLVNPGIYVLLSNAQAMSMSPSRWRPMLVSAKFRGAEPDSPWEVIVIDTDCHRRIVDENSLRPFLAD